MADGAFTLMRDEQVTYFEIEARRGKSAIEIQKALKEVGLEFVVPNSFLTRWVKHSTTGEIQFATSTCAEGLCRQ